MKYGIIHEAVRQDVNALNISALCRIAGVSRSGYYAWMDAAPPRERREETDSADFTLVKQAYEFRGYGKGARSIYMRLLHLDPPAVMNIKKILRLMRKYGLFCPIRQANPYLFYRGGVCYLSPVLDVSTHLALAYRLGDSLRVDFVLDMVDDIRS